MEKNSHHQLVCLLVFSPRAVLVIGVGSTVVSVGITDICAAYFTLNIFMCKYIQIVLITTRTMLKRINAKPKPGFRELQQALRQCHSVFAYFSLNCIVSKNQNSLPNTLAFSAVFVFLESSYRQSHA